MYPYMFVMVFHADNYHEFADGENGGDPATVSDNALDLVFGNDDSETYNTSPGQGVDGLASPFFMLSPFEQVFNNKHVDFIFNGTVCHSVH